MRYIYQYGARKQGALTILILQKLLTLNQVARQGAHSAGFAAFLFSWRS
jgi:hypothetical protein